MKTFYLSGFGKEKFYRRCSICKENESCNFCLYIPVDKSKHKHQFNCSESIYNPDVTWLGRLFGKKRITIIKMCICGVRQ